MNKVFLIGRLTRDPQVSYANTASGSSAVARYTLAVDRRFKRDGDATADFIPCVAFGKQAEFAEKYLRQGMKIAVVGCTGKLGSSIMKNIQKRNDETLAYAIAREGNAFVGQEISAIIGGQSTLIITDDVFQAVDADVFIDCTSAKAFIETNLTKYKKAHSIFEQTFLLYYRLK